jgi:putative ABC transport system substrate-binding protein
MSVVRSLWSVVGRSVFGLALCAMLFALCLSAEAQQTAKIPRIGVLSRRNAPTATNPDPNADAFRQGLRDLGYVEGKNIQFEYRYAGGSGERFPEIVAELVRLKVDVLVSGTIQAIRAAKQATKTIPIVMIIPADPVATGLIDSLARPGGNITGLTRLIRDLSGKRLELLKESVPRLSRVGVLGDSSSQTTSIALKDYETAARGLKIQLQTLQVQNPSPDFEGAFETAVKGSANALVTISGALFLSNAKRIAELAIINRLPSMHENNETLKPADLCLTRPMTHITTNGPRTMLTKF